MLHPNKKYYTQSADQEDLISIGTIGLIKGISTFDASKGARLATYAARCVENEILMYFRSQRKGAQDVSLSDCIETGRDGSALSLMDTICSEEDLFEDLSTRELHGQLRAVMEQVLTPREKAIVSLRYGLSGAADTAGDRGAVRHQPQLCLAHREKGPAGDTRSVGRKGCALSRPQTCASAGVEAHSGADFYSFSL